jgi:hypothetical protein
MELYISGIVLILLFIVWPIYSLMQMGKEEIIVVKKHGDRCIDCPAVNFEMVRTKPFVGWRIRQQGGVEAILKCCRGQKQLDITKKAMERIND